MIKKIMSVIASIAMIGSTAMFASASATSGSMFGSNTNINAPGPLDAPAMNVMNNYIASLNISDTNQTVINGEMAAVKTSSQPLYLGDVMSITKSTFTEDQLPNVLASGEVNGDDGTDYEYNLKIDIPYVITKYGEPENDLDKAIIYSDFSNDESYKLRVTFPTAVDVKELAGETITLFGKEYTFSEETNDLSNTSITLFEKSSSVNINSGETKIIEGHSVKVDIEDTDSATLYVDGVSKSVDDEWSGKINGVDIYVKSIFASSIEGGLRYIQISLNSEKIVLTNNEEVERGTNTIDGTNVIINPSGDKVREIIISVTPNSIELDNEDNLEYLGLGNSFIDPVFKTIKFSLDSINPGLTSSDRDYIKLKKSGDKGAVIEFTNKAGKDYTFSFIDGGDLNFLMSDIPENEYFITGSNEYTQIWKVEDINSENIKLKDQGSSSDTITLSLDNSKNTELSLADGSSATIHSTGSLLETIEKSINFVYTENGARIDIIDKVDDNVATTTVNESSPMNVQIIEETSYNGGDFKSNNGSSLGKVINIKIDNPITDLGLSLIEDYEYLYSKDDNTEVVTRYGTYLNEYKDERIEIYYPGEAMQVGFNIGEIQSTITNIPAEGKISEIVFGGTCISSEAARLLGVPYQTCGESFTSATNVGVNQALIQVFQDTNDKIAILVAGYEVADTLRASNYLKDNYNTMNLSPGSKLIV